QTHAAILPPESYWANDWFDAERRRTFHDNWIFAGVTQDLENHNDYLSFTVAGVPIIVRNTKGKLAAFYNICSHRHATIHPKGCRNGHFRCLYHGWTYDGEGCPVGIPDNTRSFGFDQAARKALSLRKIAVDTCGKFVFVRLSEEGPSLKEWLGSYA